MADVRRGVADERRGVADERGRGGVRGAGREGRVWQTAALFLLFFACFLVFSCRLSDAPLQSLDR